ncbi:MAG: ATP citrate (pro-S)-lyase [Candidatus Azotimanducaceae bacterium]|jgi:ATP citrate (pro-S)-lyase
MARVAISEYAAKKLVFVEEYRGISVTPETVTEQLKDLTVGNYIVKIDVGIKKRGKQGLVRVNVPASEVGKAAAELFDLGHGRCIVEEMVLHEESDEKYLSIDLTREGALFLQSDSGGVEIESADSSTVNRTILSRSEVLRDTPETSVSGVPLPALLQKMQEYHFSFLEINPYIVTSDGFTALDMAVEIDSTKESKLPKWVADHIFHKKAASPQEAAVLEQDARTQAALNLHTLNPDGSILTLLSGGGASLVGLDSLVTAGLSNQVINYSEYSGAPTRDETHVYVNTLLEVLFASKAQKKVILIAGGVANFTDVMATFQGIVAAFTDNLDTLKKQEVYVCVRRGGPNQENGLAHLRDFLNEHSIPNDVHDPSLSLGEVGNLVKKHIL